MSILSPSTLRSSLLLPPPLREPVLCWALVSERPYVENGEDKERYIEGQVVINNGSKIGGVYDVPENIGFWGYLYTKLPEKNRKEHMDHFKNQAKDLIEIRKSGHLPAIESEEPRGEKTKS